MENQYFIRNILNEHMKEMFIELQDIAQEEKRGWQSFHPMFHHAVVLCKGNSSWSPVGYLMWSEDDSLIIRQIWVSSENRREGAGSFLIDEWLKMFNPENEKQLILESPETSLKNLFNKKGYTLNKNNVVSFS